MTPMLQMSTADPARTSLTTRLLHVTHVTSPLDALRVPDGTRLTCLTHSPRRHSTLQDGPKATGPAPAALLLPSAPCMAASTPSRGCVTAGRTAPQTRAPCGRGFPGPGLSWTHPGMPRPWLVLDSGRPGRRRPRRRGGRRGGHTHQDTKQGPASLILAGLIPEAGHSLRVTMSE